MIDTRTAAHMAYFQKLNADSAVTDLADVWAHPEEDTEPTMEKSLVLIGLASASAEGGKDGGFDEVTIDIIIYTRKPEVTALYAVASAVRNALEGQTLPPQDGAAVERPRFLSADSDLLEDGETYVDTLSFASFVQSS